MAIDRMEINSDQIVPIGPIPRFANVVEKGLKGTRKVTVTENDQTVVPPVRVEPSIA